MNNMKIKLKTGVWKGDRELVLSLPDTWKFKTLGGNPPLPLSDVQIQEHIKKPIGTNRISQLAKDKKTAVIVIDDIMRPTPTYKILPFVIDDLNFGGIKDKDITIVVGSGSHQMATLEDIEQKVGGDVLKRVKAVPHDDSNNLEYLGKTKRGVPIFANKTVTKADLKIAIGGIYPHPSAGFSGGSKTFVPGICGVSTIEYIHGALSQADFEGQKGTVFRDEINTIAKTIGLDFIINVILTADRKVGRVFAGDMVKAHEAGVQEIEKIYKVKKPESADIVISNTYPFDSSYYFFSRGFWPLSLAKKDAIKILIVNGEMTKKDYKFKVLYQSKTDYIKHVVNSLVFVMQKIFSSSEFFERLNRLFFLRNPDFYLYYTGKADPNELKSQFPNAKIYSNWDLLIKDVQKVAPYAKTVALYPYAPLQYIEM